MRRNIIAGLRQLSIFQKIQKYGGGVYYLILLFIFNSCEFFNTPIKPFFEENSNIAIINRHSYQTPQNIKDNEHILCLQSTDDVVLNLELVNPKRFTVVPTIVFADSRVQKLYDDYSNKDDYITFYVSPTNIQVTFKKEFLLAAEQIECGINLDATINITDDKIGRPFPSYELKDIRCNTVPPILKKMTIMKSNDKYVLCFDMQKLSGTVHKQDVEYLVIKIDGDTWTYKVDTSYTNIDSSMFTKTYGIEGCTLTTTCPADLTYSSTNNESFTHTQESLYFITHIEATTNVKNNFSAYLTDVKGLSKESIVTNQRHKLAPPLFSEDDFNNSVISQDTGDNADGTKTIEVQMQKIDASVAEGSGNNTVTENVYINYTVKQGGNTVEEGKVLPETDGKVKIKLHPGINQVTIWQTSPNYINSDFNTFDTVKVKREQVWVDSTYTGTIITGSKKYPYTSLSEASDELANTNNSIADPRSSNNKIFIKNLPNSTEEISLSNMKTCTITSASSEKYEVKQKLNFNTTSSNVTLKNLIVNNNTINGGQNITIEDCKINGEEFKLYVNNSSTSERTINNSILPKLNIEHSNCSVYINNSTINGDIVLNKGTVSLGGTTNLTAGTIIQINNSSNSPTIKFSGSLNITGGDGSGKVKLYVENTSKNIFTIPGDINIEDFNNYFTIVDADGNEIIGKELYKANSNNVKIRNIVDSATVTLTTKKEGSSTIFNINLIAKNNIVEIVPTEKMTSVTYTLLVKQGNSVIISEDSNTPSFKYDSDLNGNYDITISATVFGVKYENGNYTSFKIAYQIGDIITKDGTRIRYPTNHTFTEEEKAIIAAVIFREASGTESALGVGINEIISKWSTRTTYIEAIASSRGEGVYPNLTINGDTEGSDNWEKIQQADTQANADTYPAFGKAASYGKDNNMTGSVENNWFIPCLKEAYDFIMAGKNNNFKNLFSQLCGDISLTTVYTSSQVDTSVHGNEDNQEEKFELIVDYSNSWAGGAIHKNVEKISFIVIHQF